MTGTDLFIGIDPGPTPGIVALSTRFPYIEYVRIVQCSATALLDVLGALDRDRAAAVQVERFVARGRMNAAQKQTHDQVAVLEQLYAHSRPVQLCTAKRAKEWATDARLEAVFLAEDLKGMRHARDAARHALFLAASSGAIHDPLSRKAQA